MPPVASPTVRRRPRLPEYVLIAPGLSSSARPSAWLPFFKNLGLVVAAAVTLVGCPKPAKQPTTPGDLPTRTRNHVVHTYSLNWSEGDFVRLRKLSLDFPEGAIEIIPTPTETLSVSLEYQVQTEEHALRSRRYLQALTAASLPLGEEPALRVPKAVDLPPELRCARERRVLSDRKAVEERVLGVCPSRLTIQLPTSLPKSLELTHFKSLEVRDVSLDRLDLTLLSDSVVRIRSTRADLRISEAGPQARLLVDGLYAHGDSQPLGEARGSLSAKLRAVGELALHRIEGPVAIDLENPEGAIVRVNGEQIRDFPYPHH
jgi:hypothetical protein